MVNAVVVVAPFFLSFLTLSALAINMIQQPARQPDSDSFIKISMSSGLVPKIVSIWNFDWRKLGKGSSASPENLRTEIPTTQADSTGERNGGIFQTFDWLKRVAPPRKKNRQIPFSGITPPIGRQKDF